jgi:hypothetical protein
VAESLGWDGDEDVDGKKLGSEENEKPGSGKVKSVLREKDKIKKDNLKID